MIAFLVLLPPIWAGCGKNEYSVGETCENCNFACFGCSGPEANDCESCSEKYSELQGICLKNCPMGLVSSNQKCLDETSTKVPFDLDFSMLTNDVQNRGESSKNFKIFSGNSSSFYPEYDSFDPRVVQGRGFFFDGSGYLKGLDNNLTFGPVFTISTWLRPKSDSGCLFSKKSSSHEFVSVSLLNSKVEFKLFLLTLENYTSTGGLEVAGWNHLYLKLFLNGKKSRLVLKINGESENSQIFSTFFKDVEEEFFYSFACRFVEGDPYDFYSGFLYTFKISNLEVDEELFLQKKDCKGCSICPVEIDLLGMKNGRCLVDCESFQYVEDGKCLNCSESCRDIGCVRNDSYCNLCLDEKCSQCNSPQGDCIKCKENAKLLNGKCQCFENFYWKDSIEKCQSCGNFCKICDGQGYLGCSECTPGYSMLSGLCFNRCPTGFSKSQEKCEKNDGTKIFDLKFEKIEGVLKDGLITLISGSSSRFYPDYEKNDPVASYKRGYYFTGSSFMRFVQLNNDISALPLNLPPEFYMGWWLSSTNSNGVLFSSSNSNYQSIFSLSLKDSHISVKIFLSPFTGEGKSASHSCISTLNLHTWTYIGVQIKLDPEGNTAVICYFNGNSEAPQILSQGFLTDSDVNNDVLIGGQQTGPDIYESFFVGFIFEVTLHVQIFESLPGFSSNCSKSCSACPESNECLSTCHISQYLTSDESCIECDDKCLKLGCRNSQNECNICQDPSCRTCIGYGSDDCIIYDCDDGFYKTKGMTECKACHSECFTCFGLGPASCLSCEETFLLNSACHEFCPAGYEENNSTCELKNSTLAHFIFDRLEGYVNDEHSGYVAVFGSKKELFPELDELDPVPVYQRGLFFTGNSSIRLPPNDLDSRSDLRFGNQFVLSFWLKSKKDGVLFTKQDSSFSEILSIRVKSKKIELNLNLKSPTVKSSETHLEESWNFLAVAIKYLNSGNSNFYLSVNFEYEVLSLGPGKFLDTSSSFSIFLGNRLSSSGPDEFWSGFLYSFSIYSIFMIPNEFTSQCKGPCEICPSSSNTCLNDCDLNTWPDDFQCFKCHDCELKTCRRADLQCNLCEDPQCAVCSDYNVGSCLKCVENAELNNGECFCSNGFTWNTITEKCELCQKLLCQSVCLTFCPTGFQKNGKKCVGEPRKVFDLIMDNVIQGVLNDTASGIQVFTSFSPEFYPHLEKTDPIPTRSRGFYFDGKARFLQAPNSDKGLILSPLFSIGIWLRAEGPGVIFARQMMGTSSFRIEITDIGEVSVICQLSQGGSASLAKYSQVLEGHEWLYLGVAVTQNEYSMTLARISVNNQAESHHLGSSAFVDFSDRSVTSIGARFNSRQLLINHFQGFILSISIWNSLITFTEQFSNSCKGPCTFCPLSGTCPGTCKFQQFFDGTCQNCSEICENGCSRPQDCNFCWDRLCEVCSNFSTDGCLKCVDGAEVKDAVCTCREGQVKSKANGMFYCESQCVDRCLSCYSKKNGDCLQCSPGMLFFKGLCLSQCQTGQDDQEGNCVEGENRRIVYFVFNETRNEVADKVTGIRAFLGIERQLIYDFDRNDPVPSYLRGLYFDGNSKFVRVGNNPVERREIVLGNSHSISVWIRPLNSFNRSCVFNKEVDQEIVGFYLDSFIKPFVNYRVASIYDNNPSVITVSGSNLKDNSWSLISVVFERTGTASMLTLHSNGLVEGRNLAMTSYFDEPKNSSFTLGYSKDLSASFRGFIYELSIFNYPIPLSDPSSFTCWCDVCTESGDCLSPCNPLFFISNNQCLECPENCTFGCGSKNSCNLHPDHLCENFTDFDPKNCKKCANLSISTSSGCQCVDLAVLKGDQCFCEEGSEEVDGFCFECLKHIQNEDFSVYFNEEYLFLVFDFKISVIPSTSRLCSILFEAETFKALGINPSCKWGNQGSQLLVKLGRNAEVFNDSLLMFSKNSLLTPVKMCGGFRGPVGNRVVKKFDPPPVTPKAIINGPNVFSKLCGNLALSGRSSTGGYGRRLIFDWTAFVGTKRIQVSSEDSLFFSNLSDINDDIHVNLTVSNWLGQSDSTSHQVEVNEEAGLNLEYDLSINTKFTSHQSKSFYVFPSSDCVVSNSLKYSWKITSQEGIHSFIDAELIKSQQTQQSKVFIPKKALGPGFYTVEVKAEDLDFNVSGSTVISLKVEYSEIMINFSPHYFSFNKQIDLVLDGSLVNDPDNTPENIDYLWTCRNGTDCSHIISDQKAKSPVVKKELLEDQREYSFSLFAIKGLRKTEDFLTVFIDSNSSLTVKFPVNGRFVNNQENFIIKTSLETDSNCNFTWTVSPNERYKLESDTNSKDLVFRRNSLDPGELYVVKLVVTQEDGKKSVFMDHFSTNFLPTGGDFLVEPINGTSYETTFKMCASGWVDLKNENFGLSYLFGFYYENQEILLNIKNESHCFWAQIPVSGEIHVFVRVFDIFGSFVEKVQKIQVNSHGYDVHIFVNESFQFFEKDWFDFNEAPAELLKVFVISDHSDYDLENILQLGNEIIGDLIENTNDFDTAAADVILSLIHKFSTVQSNEKKNSKIINLLNQLLSKIYENQVIISENRAKHFLQIVENSNPLRENSIKFDIIEISKINKMLKSLSLACYSSLGQSQSLISQSSDILLVLKLHKGSSLLNDFSSSVVILPPSESLTFNSKDSILSSQIFYNSKDPEANSQEISSGFEFSLFKSSSGQVKELKLNLEADILIKIPLINADPNPKCVYWTGKRWSDSGCHLLNYSSNTSTCGCSHTSLYSSGSFHILSSNSSNKQPIMVLISCFVSILWVLFNCVFIIKDQKEAESKIFVDEIISKIKQLEGKGKVLETELAEAGKDPAPEVSSQKRDSQFVPTAGIGIVGAYFHDNEDPKPQDNSPEHLPKENQLKQSDSIQYQNISNLKPSFLGMKSMYEEMKGPEKSESNQPESPDQKLVLSGYHETENILSSDELKKIKNAKNPPKFDFYYDKASDLSLKEKPKLGALLGPDDEDMRHFKRGSQFIPRVADIQDLQMSSEKIQERKLPKFARVMITPPQDESSKDLKLSSSTEKRDSKLLQVHINEAGGSSGSSEGSDIEKPADIEKVVETTELFTQPNSPKGASSSFYDPRPRRRYSAWIVHSQSSAICFFHENYSRSSRSSQGVTSFLLQVLLIGIIVKEMGEDYISAKGSSFKSISKNIEFQEVAAAFLMSVAANFFTLVVLSCCAVNRLPSVDCTEADRIRILSQINKKEISRFVVVSFFVVLAIVAIGVIELGLNESESIFWFFCAFIAVLLDFSVIQITKVIVYKCFGAKFVLPSY